LDGSRRAGWLAGARALEQASRERQCVRVCGVCQASRAVQAQQSACRAAPAVPGARPHLRVAATRGEASKTPVPCCAAICVALHGHGPWPWMEIGGAALPLLLRWGDYRRRQRPMGQPCSLCMAAKSANFLKLVERGLPAHAWHECVAIGMQWSSTRATPVAISEVSFFFLRIKFERVLEAAPGMDFFFYYISHLASSFELSHLRICREDHRTLCFELG